MFYFFTFFFLLFTLKGRRYTVDRECFIKRKTNVIDMKMEKFPSSIVASSIHTRIYAIQKLAESSERVRVIRFLRTRAIPRHVHILRNHVSITATF